MKKAFALLLALVLAFGSFAQAESFASDYAAMNEAAASVIVFTLYDEKDKELGKASGFMAFDDSHAVTTWAAVSTAARVEAVSDAGDVLGSFKVQGCDSDTDLALIAFDEPTGLAPLALSENAVRRGAACVSIGEQSGYNSISTGNISSFISAEGYDLIQFTAPIAEGSTGGALLDEYGRVAGMTLIGLSGDFGFWVVQNMNYAVGARHIAELWELCKNDEPVNLANWGVTDVNPESTYPPMPDSFTIINECGRSISSFKINPGPRQPDVECLTEWLRHSETAEISLVGIELTADTVEVKISVYNVNNLLYKSFAPEELAGHTFKISLTYTGNGDTILMTPVEDAPVVTFEPRRHDKQMPEGEELFTVPETIERKAVEDNACLLINEVDDAEITNFILSTGKQDFELLTEGVKTGGYAVMELPEYFLNSAGQFNWHIYASLLVDGVSTMNVSMYTTNPADIAGKTLVITRDEFKRRVMVIK